MSKFVVLKNADYSIMLNVEHISIVRQVTVGLSDGAPVYWITVLSKDDVERTFPMSLLEFEDLLRGIPSPHGYIVSV